MTIKASILVVDDDDSNHRIMQRWLSPHWEVLEADSGSAAFAHLRSAQIDLVLLDLALPGQDGFAICRLIKEQSRDLFLPVLLVSGLDGQNDRNRGFEAGADDFLRKPVNRDELILRIRAFLRLREREQTILEQVKELRRLEALKDDKVSLLVHDLRSPLDGVLSAVRLALDGAPEGVVRENLVRALQSAEMLRNAFDETLPE
jgi:DNA-binding response OmpR family regulator